MATIAESMDEGVKVLRVSGQLTMEGVAPIAPTFEAATQGSGPTVVDLSEVPLITTPGLSLLLAAAQRAEKLGGRLILTGTRGFVDDLLRRCRLDVVLPIVADPGEAMKQARKRTP